MLQFRVQSDKCSSSSVTTDESNFSDDKVYVITIRWCMCTLITKSKKVKKISRPVLSCRRSQRSKDDVEGMFGFSSRAEQLTDL
jgi:hypothetical protein